MNFATPPFFEIRVRESGNLTGAAPHTRAQCPAEGCAPPLRIISFAAL
jgi:hypothetical protein